MSGTAIVHHAELKPSKVELLAEWLPTRSWFAGTSELERVAAYRFVDPEGQVGIETVLVRSGDVLYQVALTYRGDALAEAEEFLIGTLEHSVLGTRWVYDATGDPVYVAELIRVIREADNEAGLSQGETSMTVIGSGIAPEGPAVMEAARLIRVLDGEHIRPADPLGTLSGTWTEGDNRRTEVLATLL